MKHVRGGCQGTVGELNTVTLAGSENASCALWLQKVPLVLHEIPFDATRRSSH
jgi:hypothetical protein